MINLQGIQLDSKKITLMVLVFAVIVYVDYSYLLKTQLSDKSAKAAKISKLKKDMAKLDKDYALMLANRGKPLGLQESKKFILESELPGLLKNISGLANKDKVKIMNMSPAKEAKPTDAAAAGTAAKADKGPQAFVPVKITLDLTCTYHNLGKFINDLYVCKEFIAVEEIRVISNPADFFQEKVNLVLKTYVTE